MRDAQNLSLLEGDKKIETLVSLLLQQEKLMKYEEEYSQQVWKLN